MFVLRMYGTAAKKTKKSTMHATERTYKLVGVATVKGYKNVRRMSPKGFGNPSGVATLKISQNEVRCMPPGGLMKNRSTWQNGERQQYDARSMPPSRLINPSAWQGWKVEPSVPSSVVFSPS